MQRVIDGFGSVKGYIAGFAGVLPPVEEALRDYLARSRPPDTKSRWLFAPILFRKSGPLTLLFIHYVVKKFLHRCGLEGSAGTFRHTLAARLINNGVSLEAIAAVLGHQRTQATRAYTKVHVKALREVAQNYSMLL